MEADFDARFDFDLSYEGLIGGRGSIFFGGEAGDGESESERSEGFKFFLRVEGKESEDVKGCAG